jgi:hypothetical protein
MAIALPKRRFTVFEYHKMVEAGILSGLVGLVMQDTGCRMGRMGRAEFLPHPKGAKPMSGLSLFSLLHSVTSSLRHSVTFFMTHARP